MEEIFRYETQEELYEKIQQLFENSNGNVILNHTRHVPTEPVYTVEDLTREYEFEEVTFTRIIPIDETTSWAYTNSGGTSIEQLIFYYGSIGFTLYGSVRLEKIDNKVLLYDNYGHKIEFPLVQDC